MNKIIFILLLTGLLLIQYSLALPATKSDTKSSEESKENSNTAPVKESDTTAESDEDVTNDGISARDKLFFFVLAELAESANSTLTKGITIFNNVLNDEIVKKEKNDALTAHLKNFTDFLDRVPEVDQIENILLKIQQSFSLAVDFNNLRRYYEYHTETVEESIIKAALERSGVQELDKDDEKFFKGFVKRFEKEYDIFEKSLTDKEKLEEKKIIEWYDKFRQAEGYENKMYLYAEFTDLY